MTWRGSTTVKDRIFACLPYLLPLVEGLGFGRFLLTQFPALGVIFIPITPVIAIYSGIPFAGLIIFFALFMLVIRNEKIAHFIRFNTMQAILLSIVLALCGLLLRIFAFPGANFAVETLSNTIFIGLLVAVVYSVAQTIMGRYAEIPAISDAVYMQVR
ncbi:MAG: Tic20 family protein [Cyanobacteriota bacterium]|nr:Tic20 family protein [Cyanobacteriota bacterium]